MSLKVTIAEEVIATPVVHRPSSDVVQRVFPIQLSLVDEELPALASDDSLLPITGVSDLTLNAQRRHQASEKAILKSNLSDGDNLSHDTGTESAPVPHLDVLVPSVFTVPTPDHVSTSGSRYITNKFHFTPVSTPNPAPEQEAITNTFRCEDEPIHTPGAIQRFGALVALQKDSLGRYVVRIASENTANIIGYEPEALFQLQCFTDALTSSDGAEFLVRTRALHRNMTTTTADVFTLSFTDFQGAPISAFCAMHLTDAGDIIICEFELERDIFSSNQTSNIDLPEKPIQTIDYQEPDPEAFLLSTSNRSKPLHVVDLARKSSRPIGSMDLFRILSELQVQMSAASSLANLLDTIVGLVYSLTEFHRVMVYQFDENAAGCVKSELLNPRASKDIYRGLHFPASDIPAQARDLYLVNTVRVLYDREEDTARLVCRSLEDAETPLDLKHSYLRAMSPIHLSYLANMGVSASMSISLVNDGKLWGLIACHNYGSNMRVSLPVRELCRSLGNIAGSNIGKLIYASKIESRKVLSHRPPKTSPTVCIAASSADLLSMFAADFGFLVINSEARAIGKLAAYNETIELLRFIRQENFATIFSTHSIQQECQKFEQRESLSVISGMLVIPLNSTNTDFLVFFRKGVLKELNWAGNPYQKTTPGQNYLQPRSSFHRWSEQVIGTSREWTEYELESAAVLLTIYGRFIEVFSRLSGNDQASYFTQLTTQLGRQKEAIVQKNRMTRILIQNAGHEARTPLSSIINYLEVALEDEIDERSRAHLENSLQASKSLVFVVNDLLNLTEVEDAVFTTHQDYIDLGALIRSVVLAFAAESDRKTIKVLLDIDDQIPNFVRSDPASLRQVISNLLVNAIKYTEKGIINISLRCISTTENHITIEISIQDSGFGLAESQLDSIFQDFEKILDDEDGGNIASTAANDADFLRTPNTVIGLGLAVTARFVRLNNGQLRMSSAGPGKGANVSITIPFHKATIQEKIASVGPTIKLPPPLETPPTPIDNTPPVRTSFFSPTLIPTIPDEQPSVQPGYVLESPATPLTPIFEQSMVDPDKLTILIAEDNPLNSRLLQTRLSRKGHGVQVSVDGQACADAFKGNPGLFDIILMDIQMPLVDGVESTRLIREYERASTPPASAKVAAYGRIPIIAVSASLVERSLKEYLSAGFDGWITKPINFKRLERIIDAVRTKDQRIELRYGTDDWENGGWFVS